MFTKHFYALELKLMIFKYAFERCERLIFDFNALESIRMSEIDFKFFWNAFKHNHIAF